jgi:hypothetical protein
MNVGKNDTSSMIPTWQKQQMQQQNMHDFYGNHFGGGPDSDKKRSYEQYQRKEKTTSLSTNCINLMAIRRDLRHKLKLE